MIYFTNDLEALKGAALAVEATFTCVQSLLKQATPAQLEAAITQALERIYSATGVVASRETTQQDGTQMIYLHKGKYVIYTSLNFKTGAVTHTDPVFE